MWHPEVPSSVVGAVRRRILRVQGLQAEAGDPAAAGSLAAELQEVVETRSWEPGPAGVPGAGCGAEPIGAGVGARLLL